MSRKKIFISPLDWGLGHATRCVPIIKLLIDFNCEVIIGSSGLPLELLKKEFPKLPYLQFPGYKIDYPKNGNMVWHILKSTRKLIKSIALEHKYIAEINTQHQLDGIISDNRYGLFCNNTPSILITHQLNIDAPFGKFLLKGITNKFINKFTECWVPDVLGEHNLGGNLSQKKPPKKAKYVGSISRFNKDASYQKKYDVLVIISGPEPQRTIFQNIIIPQLHQTGVSAIVALGLPDKKDKKTDGKLNIYSHLDTKQMENAINSCAVIVSRPGYSTIMDLSKFGKKAIFIPTPGQTEQEYLAKYHQQLGYAFYQNQNQINLQEGLEKTSNYTGIPLGKETACLKNTVRQFVDSL